MNRILDDRFELLELLGEGRIGRVYKARDQWEAREVAIKIPHSWHSRNPEFGARFRRELLTGMRLSHPAIVQCHETGEHQETPFLVMELIEGQSILDWFEATGRDFESLAGVLEELLDALEYSHVQRVVHQELKPANILITLDEQVKLLDFGLAGRLEDQLRIGPQPDNSLAYLSPEQAMGERGDARSDLYSLGAILFHLLAARPLFQAQDPADYLLSHLNSSIPSLSALRGDVPVWLERLVTKLLARRPDQRPQSAGEVLQWVRRRRHASDPGAFQGGPVWGRRAELATLNEALEELEEGTGASLRFSGPPGIGKTRLVDELTNLARKRGYAVLLVESTAESVLHLGDFSAHFEDNERALFENIIERAASEPLVLIMEGLHRAHASVSALLKELLVLVEELPLLLVATDRTGEQPDDAVLGQLEDFEHQFKLEGLDHDTCAQLVEERIWAPPGKAATAWFMKTTGGNPLFIKLLAEALEGKNLNVAGGECRWTPPAEKELPQSLEALLARKLDRQGKEATTILGLGASLGERFTFNALKAVTYHEERELETVLEALVREGILKEEWDSGLVRYRFTNSLLWKLARDFIHARRRRRMHLLAGRFYEKSGIWPAATLAEHFIRAEKGDKAMRYTALALEEAQAKGDLGEATFHYARLLDQAQALPDWPGIPLERFRSEQLPSESRLRTLVTWSLLVSGETATAERRLISENMVEQALMLCELFLWGGVTQQKALARLDQALEGEPSERDRVRLLAARRNLERKAGMGTLPEFAEL